MANFDFYAGNAVEPNAKWDCLSKKLWSERQDVKDDIDG